MKKAKYKIKDEFKLIDKKSTGFISEKGFVKVLKGGKLTIPKKKELKNLIGCFSFTDDKNPVNYTAFLEWAKDSPPDVEEVGVVI